MPHATEAELTAVKQRASSVSVGYNVGATAIKLIAAILTGSVGLMGEAVHSLTDIVASLFAYFSIRAAAAPPDDDHPYGHGKIESFAALAEAVFLIFIVGFIGYASMVRLIHHSPVEKAEVGLIVMAVSAGSAFLVGRYVAEIGRRSGSLALQSNAQHLFVDGWTSVGVLLTLAIVHFTGWSAADGILGIGIAAWLGYSSWKMLHESFEQLIDRRIPDHEIAQVEHILRSDHEVLSFHRLRTRHIGSVHHVDVHVVVPANWSLVQAHEVADRLEEAIERELAPAHAVIHVDPFDPVKARSGLASQNQPK